LGSVQDRGAAAVYRGRRRDVDQKIREIEGVNDVHVEVTWTPSWNKDMMTEVAKLELGFL